MQISLALRLLVLAALSSICGCVSHEGREQTAERHRMLFQEPFINLNDWHLEGQTDRITIASPGELRLACRSKMGQIGAMAFCRRDFPDHVAIEYDLVVEQHNGLLITFVAMQGVHGE